MPKRHTNAVYLGELRGRTAGKILHLERIAADVAAQIAEAKCDLDAVDRVISLFDPRIDPTTLPPILGGKKNLDESKRALTLTVAITQILEKAGPAGLSTRELGWALQLRHKLVFETPREFDRYLHNNARRRMKQLETMGILESVSELPDLQNVLDQRSAKRWRLKTVGTSIESLVADAKARGAEVIVVDAEVPSPS